MPDELDLRINSLKIEMLGTLASLGEFVVAQNATLIELAKLVSHDNNVRGNPQSLQDLKSSLDEVKDESHKYVKTLRSAVNKLNHELDGLSDA